MDGIINLLKPTGMTSSDAVARMRGVLGTKKIGHLGTLDPLASGVLPIAVGRCTRLFDVFLTKQKKYRAFFKFDLETDTLDSYGEILNRSNRVVTIEEVKESAAKFVGKISQIPPQYSAKVVDGKRAYSIARGGKSVQLKPVEIEVYNIEVVEESDGVFTVDMRVSSGTYVRSIVRDMAYDMGVYGYMAGLIRLSSGNFEIEDAVTFEELEKNKDLMLSAEKTLEFLPKITITNEQYKKMIDGMHLYEQLEDGLYTIYTDEFKGLAASEKCVQKLYLWIKRETGHNENI